MKYLIFAVFTDSGGSGDVATHSKEFDGGNKAPEDMAEEIIDNLATSGLGRANLWEVFVFKSAQNFGDAPEQVAYWNLDDGLFGNEEEDDEDDEDSDDEDEEDGDG